ncbi:SIR2 family protein [Winogradskyella sp. A2]|uniref:SIR2 family protein n=1 Tax=Winogradskyella sp. A2 TaxID=3366944 RepID=UPI00398C65FE
MEHILDLEKQSEQLIKLFKKISEGNSILFLGAGASISEKKYLSKEIIDNYESYLGKEYNQPDITKFVDILSADPEFDRDHFDREVVNMLSKYKPTDGHLTMASIVWREIITTNYDLLVEQAFDKVKSSTNYAHDLVPIKEHKDYNYRVSNSEIKYVKLNGCLQDKRKYPFAFSTDDFDRVNKFYKVVLNDLKNLSDRISFISAGYSFSDSFGNDLLEKYDSYNFRDRKWIYNIDPYPNENALHYYKQKRISIIKCSFEEFFKKYEEWNNSQLEAVVKRKRISFTNSQQARINIPHRLAIDLENVLRQLNSQNTSAFLKDVDFYKGEEPNYDIIRRGVDVIKEDLYKEVRTQIETNISGANDPFLPIFFLKGDFGIGKSTFTLRLINELSNDSELELVAFEILDFLKLKKEDLISLFNISNAKNIILFCDELEVESSFKAMIELRRELSIEQFNDFNVFFLVPIRENILEKYKLQRDFKRTYEIPVSANFSDNEISELLTKLKNVGLVNYRDASQKNEILSNIKNIYKNDSFVSLLKLVTNGKHINDLLDAYNQLSSDSQKAFLYTALLHQFKLMMPASWLKNLVSQNWEDFIKNVVQAEGKGILVQEYVNSYGTEPDLFFRTKHSVIAEELIKKIEPNKDKQFKLFEKMLNSIDFGKSNSYLINNLLKTLVRSDYYSDSKIEKLFDLGYTRLSDDPHFLLNYSINLQRRRTKKSLRKALEVLVYAESLLSRRNHRFIHRRASINYELAKLLFDENEEVTSFVSIYLNEAKELFNIKQLMDPFSPYSYTSYIVLLMWEMKNLNFDDVDKIAQRIQIEELFELAENTVTDDINRILELKAKYVSTVRHSVNLNEYKEYLDGIYADQNLRPYACILLYNYNEDNKEKIDDWFVNCEELINEMSNYTENNEVVKFLVKYYGRRLFDVNNRIKFLRLCRKNSFLEDEIPLRYYYFNFIAESYNLHFRDGIEYLKQIKGKFYGLNPSFHYVWSDSDGEELIFDGTISQWYKTKYKAVKINQYQQFIQLIKGNYKNYKLGTNVKIKLHFYLYGIKAEIIKEKENELI